MGAIVEAGYRHVLRESGEATWLTASGIMNEVEVRQTTAPSVIKEWREFL
jgi:hypothetical protein